MAIFQPARRTIIQPAPAQESAEYRAIELERVKLINNLEVWARERKAEAPLSDDDVRREKNRRKRERKAHRR